MTLSIASNPSAWHSLYQAISYVQAIGRYCLVVGEDGFAAGGGEGVDGAEGGEIARAAGGVVGEEEDAAGACPELVEGGFGLEDVGGVGPEAAVPEAVDASVEEMDLLAGVEDQRGAGGELAIEEDEVVGLADVFDGQGQSF